MDQKKNIDFSNSFGVQIEDNMLRVVEMKNKRGRINFSGYAAKKLDPGIVVRGLVKKHKTLAEVLKSIMGECSPRLIKKNKLICSIPENKSFIKVLEMPVISEDEMTEAIKWETEDNIPLPLEKVYYDWEIIGKDQAGGKMKVLLVASPKEVIESRLEVFNAANLLALGFRPDSFVLGNLFQGLFRAEVKEEKNIAIIYFGRERSVIFIKNKTTVLFTSSILFSVTELFGKLMEAATGSLAAQDKGKIEEIKKGIREAGFLNNQELGKKHRELVGDNFEELAREIQGAITYFEAGAKEKNIEKIYLTGAGATVAGIKEWIEENLGRKIEVGGEFSGFSVDGNSLAMPMNLVCDYSIAIGCALGSI